MIEIQKKISNLSCDEIDVLFSKPENVPLLTIDDELKIIHQIRKGGKEALQAKEILATSNLRFIYSVAKKYENPGYILQELIANGISGLIMASEKYDEKRGFKFMSYAIWWIRQSILKSIVK